MTDVARLDTPYGDLTGKEQAALQWRRYRRRYPPVTDQPRHYGRKKAPRCFDFSQLEKVLGTDDKYVLADQLRVTPRTIQRIRARGALTEAQADTYAVRAGLHPGNVWPNWWSEET